MPGDAACSVSKPAHSFRRESACLWAWIAAVVGLSALPNVVGYLHSDDEVVYLGQLSAGLFDGPFHLGWAKQAEKGCVLMENKVNGHDVKTRLIFNPYLFAIGALARLLQVPVAVAFEIIRVAISMLLLWVVSQISALLFEDRFRRWAALLLVSLSAGLGWMQMAAQAADYAGYPKYQPADLHAPEVSTFFHLRWEVMTTPTVLLMLVIYWQGLRYWRSGERRHALFAGLAALTLGLVHPHNLLTISIVLSVSLALVWIGYGRSPDLVRIGALWLAIVLFSTPAVLYQWSILQLEPSLSAYAGQFNPELNPLRLLGGYGLIGLLAILGAVNAIRGRRPELSLLAVWMICGLAMLYIRVPPLGQVFALDGLHVAMCLLGASCLVPHRLGLEPLSEQITQRRLLVQWVRRGVLVGLLVFASLTNLLQICNEVALAGRSPRVPFTNSLIEILTAHHGTDLGVRGSRTPCSHYFIPRTLQDAYDWLDRSTVPSQCVLSSPAVSQYIPSRTGNRTFLGHPRVTVDFAAKSLRYHELIERNDPESQTEFRDFLLEHQIDFWLWYPPIPLSPWELEDEIPALASRSGMQVVYSNARAVILQKARIPPGQLARFRPAPPEFRRRRRMFREVRDALSSTGSHPRKEFNRGGG